MDKNGTGGTFGLVNVKNTQTQNSKYNPNT